MSDKTYKAKVAGKWLKANGKLVKNKKDADTFESKTEPTQIINQLKKDGKLPKNVKPQVLEESYLETSDWLPVERYDRDEDDIPEGHEWYDVKPEYYDNVNKNFETKKKMIAWAEKYMQPIWNLIKTEKSIYEYGWFDNVNDENIESKAGTEDHVGSFFVFLDPEKDAIFSNRWEGVHKFVDNAADVLVANKDKLGAADVEVVEYSNAKPGCRVAQVSVEFNNKPTITLSVCNDDIFYGPEIQVDSDTFEYNNAYYGLDAEGKRNHKIHKGGYSKDIEDWRLANSKFFVYLEDEEDPSINWKSRPLSAANAIKQYYALLNENPNYKKAIEQRVIEIGIRPAYVGNYQTYDVKELEAAVEKYGKTKATRDKRMPQDPVHLKYLYKNEESRIREERVWELPRDTDLEFDVEEAKQMVTEIIKGHFEGFPEIDLNKFQPVQCTNVRTTFWFHYGDIRLFYFSLDNNRYVAKVDSYGVGKDIARDYPFSWIGVTRDSFKSDMLDAAYVAGEILSKKLFGQNAGMSESKKHKVREWTNGDRIMDKSSSLYSQEPARWKTVYNIPIEDGQTITDYSMGEGNSGTVTWFTKDENGQTLKCVRSGLMAYSKEYTDHPVLRFVDNENGDEFFIEENPEPKIGKSFVAIALYNYLK